MNERPVNFKVEVAFHSTRVALFCVGRIIRKSGRINLKSGRILTRMAELI